MTGRTVAPLLAAASFLAACASPPTAEVDLSAEFVPFVADSTDNVGLGNSIAVTEDGTPYIAYFGFPAEVAEGEIAPIRPVGSAFIPAVQLASIDLTGEESRGIWSRGAVAQAEEFSGVTVPFGPEVVESLARMTPESANGTSIALDAAGAPHVAWAGNTGIWYASSGESSSVAQVARYDVSQAGPVGRPGIAMDGSTPWVAWTAAGATSLEVHVATPGADDAWTDTVVAEAELCNGCPPPAPTGIEVSADGPVVVFADQAAGSVVAARLDGDAWTTATVDGRATGDGLSTTTDTGGEVFASYFDGDGGVVLASGDGASWSTADVGAISQGADGGDGRAAPTTGVAADDQGTVTVAWDDPGADTVRLAQRTDGAFEEVEIPASQGGRAPSVATTPDGKQVFVAWYDAATQDLLMGVLGGVEGLVVANPSPAQEPVAGGAVEGCGDEGEIVLEVSADSIAFSTNCLVAPAGEEFTITFDQQDTVNPHNVAAYVERGGDLLAEPPPIAVGPQVQELTVPPQEPGEYFFNCQAHPEQMTGTLAVVEA